MPIKRRLSEAQQAPSDHRGNHPMLKIGSVHNMIWQYVKQKPGSTREQIRFGCSIHPNAVNARVNELINEGLLRETGERVKGASGRSGKCLEVMPGGNVGRGRDALGIDIRVYVNAYGQYSIEAELLGEMDQAREANPRLIYVKEVVVRIPRPKEVKEAPDHRRRKPAESEVPAEVSEPVIIDVEFSELPD
jgi:hypothetical protein